MKVQIKRDKYYRFESASIFITDSRELTLIALSLFDSIKDCKVKYEKCLGLKSEVIAGVDVDMVETVQYWKQKLCNLLDVFVQLEGEERAKAYPDIFRLAQEFGVLGA